LLKKSTFELERFGPTRFKGIGYRELSGILNAGALGAEITIKGKIPGKRAKKWRFVGGYLKKCGNISDEYLDKGEEIAKLRPGVVGVVVTIMHKDTPLPDKIKIFEPEKALVEEAPETPVTETAKLEPVKEEIKEKKPEVKETPKKPAAKKPAAKKAPAKKPAAKKPVKEAKK